MIVSLVFCFDCQPEPPEGQPPDPLAQAAQLISPDQVLRLGNQGDHDLFQLSGQPLTGDRFGLQAVKDRRFGISHLQVFLVVVFSAVDVFEPVFVLGLHALAGGDPAAGQTNFPGGEHIGMDQVEHMDIFDPVEFQIPDEGVPDNPAAGVVVDYPEEIKRPPEVYAMGLQFIDEILQAEDGRLAAQGDDRYPVSPGDLREERLVAQLLGEEDDVGVGADSPVGLVVVPETDIGVTHQVEVPNHVDELVDQLLVLVHVVSQRLGPGEGGLDVHVPEGPDQFIERGFLSIPDPLPDLPDDVPHKARDIDRILGGTLLEVFLEPLPGLIVDQVVKMADSGGLKAVFKRRLHFFGVGAGQS